MSIYTVINVRFIKQSLLTSCVFHHIVQSTFMIYVIPIVLSHQNTHSLLEHVAHNCWCWSGLSSSNVWNLRHYELYKWIFHPKSEQWWNRFNIGHPLTWEPQTQKHFGSNRYIYSENGPISFNSTWYFSDP